MRAAQWISPPAVHYRAGYRAVANGPEPRKEPIGLDAATSSAGHCDGCDGSAAVRKGVESGDVICEDCGETNKPGTEFCMFCGAYLGWQQPAPGSANEVTRPLQATAAGPAAPAPAQPEQPSAALRQAQGTNLAATGPPVARPEPSRPAPQQTQSSAPPDAAGYPPVHDGATSVAAMPVEPIAPTCPTCGRPIGDARRFCGHCGQQFVLPGAGGSPAVRPTAKPDTWWTRLWDNKDRAARRSFRRSLPPLYRWRRMIIAVLCVLLAAGGLTLIHHSPKSFVMARYYDLRKTLVVVKPVDARTIPPDTSAQDTKPTALVDNTKAAWLMNWSASTKGAGCGAAPTTSVVELAFQETRLREIDVYPGLSADNPNRTLQFRPKTIWIAYGDQCVQQTLDDVDLQKVPLDTKVPIGSIRISVIDAYPPGQPAGSQQVLGFTEIRLLARPRT